MDQFSVLLKRFGDEQSTLLDQFERLSFEIQLNQAILGRSLSEPGRSRLSHPPKGLAVEPPMAAKVKQGKTKGGFGIEKMLKRFLKPMFPGRSRKVKKKGTEVDEIEKVKDDRFYGKAFSRSVRV